MPDVDLVVRDFGGDAVDLYLASGAESVADFERALDRRVSDYP